MVQNYYEDTVTKYAYSLYPFALSLTRHSDDAKDLVQDTLLKALTNQHKFKDGTNLKAWIYTIMKYTFINNYRRNKTKRIIIENTHNLNDSDTGFVEVCNNAESVLALQNLNQAAESIAKEFREPFMMFYEGFKYNEIASKLSLPLGTIKSRIFLARSELRKKVNRY